MSELGLFKISRLKPVLITNYGKAIFPEWSKRATTMEFTDTWGMVEIDKLKQHVFFSSMGKLSRAKSRESRLATEKAVPAWR